MRTLRHNALGVSRSASEGRRAAIEHLPVGGVDSDRLTTSVRADPPLDR
jgi:hypothetical protein